MAAIAPIPRTPGDRSVEALWRFAEDMEQALIHLAANIEGENIRDGAIGANKLGGDVSGDLAILRRDITANRQGVGQLRGTVQSLSARVGEYGMAISSISARTGALEGTASGLSGEVEALAEEIDSTKEALQDALEAVQAALEDIQDTQTALLTAIEGILQTLNPPPEPGPGQ